MDGPLDPLATARTGGLDSVVQLEEDNGPGVLGEVFIAQGDERQSADAVRGVKITQVCCSRSGNFVALDDKGLAHDLRSGDLLSDVALESLALGETFMAGIGLEDKRLYTWGDGAEGRLGLGHTRGSALPEAVASMEPHAIDQVACGQAHALALSSEGAVYSWGRGIEGQTGQGLAAEVNLKTQPHLAFRLVPKHVQGLHRVRVSAVACGAHFSAALDASGAVWTWGQGLCGQLGSGRCTARTVPRRVLGPLKGERTARSQVSSSRKASSSSPEKGKKPVTETVEDYLDVLPESARVALGPNDGVDERAESTDGGIDSRENPSAEHEIGGEEKESKQECGEPAVENANVSAGASEDHSSASAVAQLDFSTLSTTKSSAASTNQVEESDVIVGLACGDAHVLALDANGGVLAWGLNAHGQLGLGDTESRDTPTRVSTASLPPVTHVTACRHASGAIAVSGIPYTWGYKLGTSPQRLVVREDKPDARVALGEVSPHAGAVVLIPTLASSVHPSNGPLQGGHEVAISGVGFWESGCIKVRFVPMQRKDKGGDDDAAGDGDGSSSARSADHADDIDALSDNGLDLDDNASALSSESSHSGTSAAQPRETQVVDGAFDPATGRIVCTAPPSPVAGVVLVQVALDGSTYTTDEVFYIYTEPCTLIEATPRILSCSADAPQYTEIITVKASGLYAMPELCIRLSSGPGKEFIVPATLRPLRESESEEKTPSEDRDGGAQEEDNEEEEVVAEALVNMNEVMDALTDAGEASCVAEVAISLNGVAFAPTSDLSESVRTCLLSRPKIAQVYPRGLACADQSDENGDPIEITVAGLLAEHADAIRVRLRSHDIDSERFRNCEPLEFEIPASMNAELTQVRFEPPRVPREALPNGQGWGFRGCELSITTDGGRSWALSPEPFVFFAGDFESPTPSALPSEGGNLEIATPEDQQGWLYEGAEPIVTLTSTQRPSLPAVRAARASVSRAGSLIACSTGDLSEFYANVRDFMLQQIHAEALQSYYAEHPLPDVPEDEAAEDEAGKEAREAATAEARETAETHAAQVALSANDMPVYLQVHVAVNGRDVVHHLDGSVELYQQPSVASIEPKEVAIAAPSRTNADEDTEEKVDEAAGSGDANEGPSDVPPNEVLTIELVGPYHIPRASARSLVRFTHSATGHAHDLAIRVPRKSPDEGETQVDGALDGDQGIHGDFKRETVLCELPAFQEEGDYVVTVALNGADFPALPDVGQTMTDARLADGSEAETGSSEEAEEKPAWVFSVSFQSDSGEEASE